VFRRRRRSVRTVGSFFEIVVVNCASAISDRPRSGDAGKALVESLSSALSADAPQLVFLFASAHFEDELDDALAAIQAVYPDSVIVGCTAQGTIGGRREIERGPSMAALAAVLPGVRVSPFALTQAQLESMTGAATWESMIGDSPENVPVFVAFGDPFSVDIQRFVAGLNATFPGSPLFGGVASAAEEPGQNRLVADCEICYEGMVGVALSGNIDVVDVVSQGCRPIGRPFVITRATRNIIHELGGQPPLAQFQAVFRELDAGDEKLAREALLIGRAIDERRDVFQRGDFLIHNIMAADSSSGAIAIAGPARVGTTVQFHVRDAQCADEDLKHLLAPHAARTDRPPYAAALLFGCNGRGTRMWPYPNHDINVLHEVVGPIPTAGFFCAGEFGPVGGRNFIHGFTASIALMRPRTESGGGSERV